MTDASRVAEDRFVDLSARAKFRVIGADRFRFINGQITNDLRKANEASAIEACVLNAKGRMEGHVFIREVAESYIIDVEAAVREKLRARLERYIIADDVEIEDVTDSFSVFHVLSPEPPPTDCGRIVSARRFAARGWDIWSDASKRNDVWQQLSLRYVFLDPAAAEVLRIEEGIPQWGFELTEEIIPVEANLEMRTIDYQKGCYIGQEVISRMKMSGQTNKRLSGLIALDDAALHPQMKLIAASKDAKEVGWITSATRSERIQREIALGYVKRGFNSIGTRLNAVGAESKPETVQPVEVVSLPFH
jgi:tRNA-modifying protein YgfZ